MTKAPQPDEFAADPKTTAETLAEAGRIMAGIPGGTGNPAPAADPMQKGSRALREIDEDAQRLWKVKAPKDVRGEIAAYLVDGEVTLVHQFPSGKFAVFRRANLAAWKSEAGDSE